MADVRRLVAPLLAAGAVLVVAALVWPTQRMELATQQGTVPLLEVWLWGRVRSLSAQSSTDLAGSFGTLAVLGLSAVLALVAAGLWLWAVRRRRTRRRPGTVAAGAVGAALAVAAVGLTIMTAGLGFGWYAPGVPTVTRTAVAVFPQVAVGLWFVALVLMLALLLRGRGGPDAAPDGSPNGSSGGD